MESKIYICKTPKSIYVYNCATFKLVPGEKYIVEVKNYWYYFKSIKNNNEAGSIFELDIDKYFEPLEDVRKNKLNLLLDGI